MDEVDESRRISVDLPVHIIDRFDQLKREWGLRGRGAVLKRLLEVVFVDNEDNIPEYFNNNDYPLNYNNNTDNTNSDPEPKYNDTTALVLISTNPKDTDDLSLSQNIEEKRSHDNNITNQNSNAIDLPGFIRKKSETIRSSLDKTMKSNQTEEPFVTSVTKKDIAMGLRAANNHWVSLYGQSPRDNVVEAAMLWIARDVWPNIDSSEGSIFTWTVANNLMIKHCSFWEVSKPSLDKIIVMAGVLEDPFGTKTLPERTPSLIRRFVNRFKRSQNVTSFQTLESTMTIHGALKFLGLPTKPGSSLTLNKIRDIYKKKALTVHPDSGGSTEDMRKLNEAYQLLKELYRQNT